MKYNCHCSICNISLQESRNSLSLHIRSHDISKEDYYKTYVDSRCTCVGCDKPARFLNLQLGYATHCKSCGIKQKQWGVGSDDRKTIMRKNMTGNTFSKGRPKGSKNKNEYPMSDSVINKMATLNSSRKLCDWWLSKTHKEETKEQIRKAWATKTDDDIKQITIKRDISAMKKGTKYYTGRYKPKMPEKYEGDPTDIIYRSSWELKFMNWCDISPSVIKWSSESTIVPYRCPTDNRIHRYFVDAKIKVQQRDGALKTYLVEVKPSKQTQPPVYPGRNTQRYLTESIAFIKNQAKWKAATEYAKDRGYEFKIITEYELGLTA